MLGGLNGDPRSKSKERADDSVVVAGQVGVAFKNVDDTLVQAHG